MQTVRNYSNNQIKTSRAKAVEETVDILHLKHDIHIMYHSAELLTVSILQMSPSFLLRFHFGLYVPLASFKKNK